MPNKRHHPEEIVAKLRQGRADVAGPKRCRCGSLDWSDRSHLLSLWTALPLQADFELIRVARCKHLSGVIRLGRSAQMGKPLAHASTDGRPLGPR